MSLSADVRREDAGEKAANLSTMLRAGVPVPPGFVIDAGAWRLYADDPSAIGTAVRDEIERHLALLNCERVMVRSSAIGEDSAGASFAGQLDSFQCACDVATVIAHVARCWASYDKENVRVYQERTGVSLAGMGVVVQELIDPDHAGVLFTRAPDDPDKMLCEYVEGHGEKLVSGDVTPESLRWRRDGTAPDHGSTELTMTGMASSIQRALYKVALELEAVFGTALDIEFVVLDDAVSIVQARPITVSTPAHRIRWSNTNVNENYPGPITPLLYSIARDAYYHYFKNLSRLLQVPEDAIRELEPDYTNIIGAFGCRMYYNMTSIHNVIGRSPFAGLLRKSFDNFVGYQQSPATHRQSSRITSARRFITSFARLNYKLADNVREFEQRVDAFTSSLPSSLPSSHASSHPSSPPSSPPSPPQRGGAGGGVGPGGGVDQPTLNLRTAFHQFIEIRMHSWYRASLADFFAMVYHGLIGQYCRHYFPDDHQAVHNTLVQAIPGLISSHPVRKTWRIAEMIRSNPRALEALRSLTSEEMLKLLENDASMAAIKDAVSDYLREWGFRCSGELMLTEDNFCDAPERFVDLLRGYVEQHGDDPELIIREKAREREQLLRSLRSRLVKRRRWTKPLATLDVAALETLVKLCFAGIASRERVRLKQAHLYYGFKRVVQVIGDDLVRRNMLDDRDDVLFLRYQEVGEILSTSDLLPGSLRETVALRRAEFARASTERYPDDFTTASDEYPLPERDRELDDNGTDVICGLSACGGRIRGRVRVLESVLELGRIRKGDILVTRQTDPGWATVFPLISGLIVERGGMLSHGAIVAREFGIPAIIGVAYATQLFQDDDVIELNADRGEIYRYAVDTPAVHTPAL